jgi:hypothetical protein
MLGDFIMLPIREAVDKRYAKLKLFIPKNLMILIHLVCGVLFLFSA